MRQWMLRITAYAERLLQDLDTIDWSDSLKEMQRNWIGRSEGAEVDFPIAECGVQRAECQNGIRVFTTRPDTLFGATYMVLAPEHTLVDAITTPAQRQAVEAYKAEVAKKSDLERTELAKEKTGVFTGAYAINPVNREKIPIWIADYVLISYGTGAIMAVPGHDTRDFEFATKFNLPIVQVVEPPAGTDWHGYVEDGISVNSASADISHQRPADARGQAQDHRLAGIQGPRQEDHQLQAARLALQPPALLGRAIPDRLEDRARTASRITRPCPTRPCRCCRRRSTTTSRRPTASRRSRAPRTGSTCPTARRARPTPCPNGPAVAGITCATWIHATTSAFCGPEAEHYWMGTARSTLHAPRCHDSTPGVDLYVGGTEHAVLHLLYARFWHKVLFDLGHVSTPEPFFKLVNQGLILGEDGQKMSKSRGNVINPDDIVREYRRRRVPPLRDVHGPAGDGEALEHQRRGRRLSVPRPRLAPVRG